MHWLLDWQVENCFCVTHLFWQHCKIAKDHKKQKHISNISTVSDKELIPMSY